MSESYGTDVATIGGDPYASYGAKVGAQGTFLTFKAGEFLYGQEGKSLPLGTRLAANMQGLRIGWRRWWDDKITDDLTELLNDRPVIKQRNELGDTDSTLWKKDKEGRPFDPWQLTNVLEFVDTDGERYIYATGSRGGIGAVGKLCSVYGKAYRQRPGMVPIVELGNEFYMHASYGKTYVPVFNLVDWAPEDALEAIAGETEQERVAPPTAPPPAAGKKARF